MGRAPPLRVAGHCVKGPACVSVGFDNTRLAFAARPAVLAIVDCSAAAPLNASKHKACADVLDGMTLYSLEDVATEEISFVELHPTLGHLAVGTVAHGVYLCSCTSVAFSSQTRLPRSATGDLAHSAAFLVGATPLEDLFVLSSSFLGKGGENPYRLTLWHIHSRSVVWRGAVEPLESICSFPGGRSFAACTRTTVSIWNIQFPGDGLEGIRHEFYSSIRHFDEGNARSKVLVSLSSQPCSTVEELQDVEYLQCACWPHAKDNTFVALSSGGFIIAFDKTVGTMLRWMDCKVCPASSVSFTWDNVLVAGDLARFFDAHTWEFRGKLKPEGTTHVGGSSYITSLLDSLCTGAVGCGPYVFLFSSNGEWSGFSIAADGVGTTFTTVRDAKGTRLPLKRCVHFSPIPITEGTLQWYIPASTTAATWCLWSPVCMRIFCNRLNLVRYTAGSSSCAVYHCGQHVLLTCHPATLEIVAYSPTDEWREWAKMDVSQPFISLCCATDEACAGLQADNTVVFFTCTWKVIEGEAKSLLLNQVGRRTFTDCPPLKQLVFLMDKLIGVAARSIVHLDSGYKHSLSSDVVAVCPVGRDLILIHHDCCVYYKTDTRSKHHLAMPMEDILGVVFEPACDLLVGWNGTTLAVMRLADETVLYTIQHSAHSTGASAVFIQSASLAVDADHVNVLVCDSRGMLTTYGLDDHDRALNSKGAPLAATATLEARSLSCSARGRRERVERGQNVRTQSSGPPTSKELSERLNALFGYYEHNRTPCGSSLPGKCRMSRVHRCDAVESADGASDPPPKRAPLPTTANLSPVATPSLSVSSGFAQGTDSLRRKTGETLFVNDSADLRVSASVVEVSDLTVTVDSQRCLSSQEGSQAIYGSLATPNKSPNKEVLVANGDVLSRSAFAQEPQCFGTSPQRRGSAPLLHEGRLLASCEDVVNLESMDPCSPPLPHLREEISQWPAPVPMAAAQEESGHDNLAMTVSTPSARLFVHSKKLRDSLLAFQDLLDGDNGADDLADADGVNLAELSSLLSNVAAALQARQAQSLTASSTERTSAAGTGVSDVSSQVIISELLRLQQQSSRIESQNKEILSKLHCRT